MPAHWDCRPKGRVTLHGGGQSGSGWRAGKRVKGRSAASVSLCGGVAGWRSQHWQGCSGANGVAGAGADGSCWVRCGQCGHCGAGVCRDAGTVRADGARVGQKHHAGAAAISTLRITNMPRIARTCTAPLRQIITPTESWCQAVNGGRFRSLFQSKIHVRPLDKRSIIVYISTYPYACMRPYLIAASEKNRRRRTTIFCPAVAVRCRPLR